MPPSACSPAAWVETAELQRSLGFTQAVVVCVCGGHPEELTKELKNKRERETWGEMNRLEIQGFI